MLMRCCMWILFLGVVGGWMGACSPSLPEEIVLTSAVADQVALSPGEVIHISGEGSFVSDPFSLEGSGSIELFWKQDCQVFYLQMVNANEALANTPNGTIIFESAASPTENTEMDDFQIPYPFIPGEYLIKVEAQGGTWEVWAKVTQTDGE